MWYFGMLLVDLRVGTKEKLYKFRPSESYLPKRKLQELVPRVWCERLAQATQLGFERQILSLRREWLAQARSQRNMLRVTLNPRPSEGLCV